MDQEQFFTALQARLDGLLYFSESEAPVLAQAPGTLSKEELLARITSENGVSPEAVKIIASAVFFSDILNQADPGDQVVVEHARRFGELYTFLKSNCSDLQVFRLEGGTRVPIIITAFLPEQRAVALSTYAIES